MKRIAHEVNFDGLVGPTHNYSGLSYGNTASEKNKFSLSNPREAALQGLEKMKFMADKGYKQAVLPPQERPFISVLRQLGFSGSDHALLKDIDQQAPALLLAISSAASMWTANAATISPSSDSKDGRLHLTPANLSSKFHRAIEAEKTSQLLKAIFRDPQYFIVHNHLPSSFSDEGAANHTRFCKTYGEPGIQLFAFGRYLFQTNTCGPKIYPARQAQEASAAIARLHELNPRKVLFVQQHPDAIDAGAFHNDVVSVGNKNVFFFHEQAFLNQPQFIQELKASYEKECDEELICLEVETKDISLKNAISSYLFNSQLVSRNDGSMALIAPSECLTNPAIKNYLDILIEAADNPIKAVHFMDLRQSMQNGGGPACLRLRVVMSEEEISAVHQGIFLTDNLYQQLKDWITVHYRDRLAIRDLADPCLFDESTHALSVLNTILKL